MKIIEISRMKEFHRLNCWIELLFRKSNEISLPISCKLVSQTVLQTSLENVLSLRLREGYTVRRVQIGKGLLLRWVIVL